MVERWDFNTAGDAAESGLVEDDFSTSECGVEHGLIADAAADHLCGGCRALQVGLPAVGEVVQDADVGAALHKRVRDMAADEACSAGDADAAAGVGGVVGFKCGMQHCFRE